MTKKTVTIIGMAPSGINAPFDMGERWGLNHAYVFGSLDRLFLIHDFSKIYFRQPLKDLPVKNVWTRDKIACHSNWSKWTYYNKEEELRGLEVNLLSIPIDEQGMIKIAGTTYFECSLVYLIGQAIVEGFERIILYGVEGWEYHGTGPYGSQVKNIEAWLWMAQSRGIEVLVPWNLLPKINSEVK